MDTLTKTSTRQGWSNNPKIIVERFHKLRFVERLVALNACFLLFSLLAIGTFNIVHRLNPEQQFGKLFNSGIALEKEQRYEDAIEKFEKAALIKPDDALLLLNLGNCYEMCANGPQALKNYNRYLMLNPTGAGVSWTKAQVRSVETQLKVSDSCNRAHWAKVQMPISVFIEKGSTRIKNYRDDFPAMFRKSMAEWCKASEGRVSIK